MGLIYTNNSTDDIDYLNDSDINDDEKDYFLFDFLRSFEKFEYVGPRDKALKIYLEIVNDFLNKCVDCPNKFTCWNSDGTLTEIPGIKIYCALRDKYKKETNNGT